MEGTESIIVGIPLYHNCTLMDFAGATQVFAAPFGFKPIWIANDAVIVTTEGVPVTPNYTFEDCPTIDILFIPGGNSDGVGATMENNEYLDFIRKVSKTTLWKGSVCTGAFILAASGVLNNCLATTYWSQIPTLELLASKFNLTIHEGYPRFLLDEKQKIFTGGGISSSLDLALELVLRIKGKEIAELTQLFIQYQPNPPVNSGDPAHAPIEITAILRKQQEAFTKAMVAEVNKLL